MTDFNELLDSIKKFGIGVDTKKVTKPIKKLKKKELVELESKGFLEIENIEDILPPESGLDLLTVTEDGRVIRGTLHIPNDHSNISKNSDKPDKLRRFHIYRCQTINTSKHENKWHYSIRKDGKFVYNFKDRSVTDQELLLCGHCKDIFKRENRQRSLFSNMPYMKEFNLETFLSSEPFSEMSENIEDEYFHIFGDGTLDLTLIDMDYHSLPKDIQKKLDKRKYVKEWHRISKEYRELKNYTCEECGWKPSSKREERYIHTHHINKDTQNNGKQNLKALCIECHSKQPKHGHMAGLPDLVAFQNLK